MLQHQKIHTNLLQHLLIASGTSVPRLRSLDVNKKGEKQRLQSPAELVSSIPPPYNKIPAELKIQKERDSIRARLDEITARVSLPSTTILTITTTIIFKVLTPEIVVPSIKEKGEPFAKNEFSPSFLAPTNSDYTRARKESSGIYFALAKPNKHKLLGVKIKSVKEAANDAPKILIC